MLEMGVSVHNRVLKYEKLLFNEFLGPVEGLFVVVDKSGGILEGGQ